MPHHWRKPYEKTPKVEKRPLLTELFDLIAGAFHPEGSKGEWLPFEPGPSSLHRNSTEK
jgi:hypothetical protein